MNNPTETTMAAKKQHNPRRHVFAATTTNENQNPVQLTTVSSGEKVKNLYFIDQFYAGSLASKFC